MKFIVYGPIGDKNSPTAASGSAALGAVWWKADPLSVTDIVADASRQCELSEVLLRAPTDSHLPAARVGELREGGMLRLTALSG